MDPLVSIIVPVYNVLPYLHEALDSLTGQTYRNLEIILIDDGSSDGSKDVCDEYAFRDPRIKVIHQENKGLSAARNTGLDAANGDFIAFLDPDDAFHSMFIEKMLSSMLNEDADMALCRFSVQDTAGKMKWSSSDKFEPSINAGIYDRSSVLNALIDERINVSVWNKLYKKALWKAVRFSEGHVFEDIETAYQICSQIDKLCVIHESLYNHRKRPGSITLDNSHNNIDDVFQAFLRTESYISANVPSLFTREFQGLFQQKLMKYCFGCYIISKRVSGVPKREYRTKLRQKIIETGKKYNIKEFGLRIRLAYFMLSKCPVLFDLCYPCYSFLNRINRK